MDQELAGCSGCAPPLTSVWMFGCLCSHRLPGSSEKLHALRRGARRREGSLGRVGGFICCPTRRLSCMSSFTPPLVVGLPPSGISAGSTVWEGQKLSEQTGEELARSVCWSVRSLVGFELQLQSCARLLLLVTLLKL